MSSSNNIIKCSECESVFKEKKNLYAHLRKFHDKGYTVATLSKGLQLECSICSKLMGNKYSLNNHLKKFHNTKNDEITPHKSRLCCPHNDCFERVPNYKSLWVHLNNEHSVKTEIENFEFSSIEDFEKWKNMIQQQTLSRYTLDSASKLLSTNVKKRYYKCHRSYAYNPKGKNIRSLKSMGSKKIGKVCPSYMEVAITTKNNENTVKVKFCKTHYGHAFELGHMALDKQSRAEIAGKLKEGVSFNYILDSIRDNKSNQIGTNQRMSIIKRKDLHNIVRDYNIDYNTKRHRLIKLTKTTPTKKNNRITSSHKLSCNISPNMISALENKEWLVCSSSDDSTKYHVSYIQETCSDSCLKCNICKICIHSFKCSCTESLIKSNICKHIHACAQLYLERNSNCEMTIAENCNATEVDTLLDMYQSNITSKVHSNGKIVKKAALIIGLSNNTSITEENRVKIENYLDNVINILNEGDAISLETAEDDNVKKKIEKQQRLYSARKKQVVSNAFQTPSLNETNIIKDEPSNSSDEILHIHSEFDHSYV